MSKIEWTDETWNPVVGCSRISHGCDNCYAIKMAHRFKHPHYAGLTTSAPSVDWTGVINAAPAHIWNKPGLKKRPTVYFVNSMSDLFHDQVQDAWIVRAFDIMAANPHHVFQVLTKRPSRAVAKTRELGLRWTDNIWAGTSIESDKFALSRSRELLKLPAAIRFVSAEPLLSELPSLPVEDLGWLIAGGESGVAKTVRPVSPGWLRDLRDRCQKAGTPFFFKQWGSFGEDGRRRSKEDNGHLLDGRAIFEMPAAAYDQLPLPDTRWVRHTGGRLALHAMPEEHPSQRFAASASYFSVVKGKVFEDDDDAILESLKINATPKRNPNLRPNLGPEHPASYVDFYEK